MASVTSVPSRSRSTKRVLRPRLFASFALVVPPQLPTRTVGTMSAVTLQRRLLPRPACSPRALAAPPLRLVVTSRRWLSTSTAAYSTEAVASPSSPSFNSSRKVETIPFHLSPQDARERLDEAGASAFGVGSVFSLLWSRFLRRWGLGGGEQSGGAKLVAQKALLIPTWRVDIALKGKGLIGDSQMHLSGKSLPQSRA